MKFSRNVWNTILFRTLCNQPVRMPPRAGTFQGAVIRGCAFCFTLHRSAQRNGAPEDRGAASDERPDDGYCLGAVVVAPPAPLVERFVVLSPSCLKAGAA